MISPINKTKCVIILGMHRSGTSSLTGSLQNYGLYLGNIYEKSPNNPRGNRENKKIMTLNESILSYSGGSWLNPPENLSWSIIHLITKNKIVLEYSLKRKIWGFKDPRTILTLPFWRKGLLNYDLVGTFRHPFSVAKSLYLRNKIHFNQGLELWKNYNRRLLEYLKLYNFPIISFDVNKFEYFTKIKNISKHLGLVNIDNTHLSFFDEKLRHFNKNKIDKYNKIPKDILDIYAELESFYKSQSI